MSDPDETLVLDPGDEDHLIRHLGAAVVALWPELPRDIQDKLLAHTRLAAGDGEADDLDPRLKLFVGSHLRKPGDGGPV